MTVCLYPDRVDIAAARVGPGERPVLQSLDSFERGGSDADALLRIGKKFGLGRVNVTTLMPAKQYQLLTVEAPAVPAEEVREAVRWQIRDLIDFPVEQATLDVMDIPAASGRQKSVFVVAARNDNVSRVMRSFLDAEIALDIIDVQELAQRNIASLCAEPDRGIAMLSFDDAGGYLTFTYNGALYLSRHIEIGAAQLLDAERQTVLFERIGLELQRSTDGFERQFSHIPLTRLALAPHAFAPALRDFLGDYLTMSISVVNLADVIDISAVPSLAAGERQAQCFATIGAALRPVTA